MKRSLAALLSVGAIALTLSSCAFPSTNDLHNQSRPPTTHSNDLSMKRINLTIERDDAINAIKNLPCEKLVELEDDVYHFDKMRGADCLTNDNDLLMFRVYENSESVGQILEDWTDLLNEHRQVMIGTNWFAIGKPKSLNALGKALGFTAQYGIEVPPPVEATREQVRLRTCSIGLATLVSKIVMDEDDADLTSSYEEVFPGIEELSSRIAEELQAAGFADVDYFEYEISKYGTEIKSFCSQPE